jgi:hypothetical protein
VINGSCVSARFGVALLVVGLASCSGAAPADGCASLDEGNVDRCLRLNHLQFLGTHNSYHVEPTRELYAALDSVRPGWGENLAYTHRPLPEQLAELHIRQLELDVFADPIGGHYARPAGRRLIGQPAVLEDEQWTRPGFKVLHVQDVDYQTRCPTLVACLADVRQWSAANPAHLPVMILVEVKDSPAEDSLGLEFTVPVPVRAAELDALDAEILSVLGRERLLTPDDVRRHHPSLEQAVLTDGWPSVADVRGKFLFALDNTAEHRDEYLRGHPNLESRVLFVSSSPGEPTGGFIKMNDALADQALIHSYVQRGYLVRTRADIAVQEGKSGDTTRREAALASGAHYISTDYPELSPFGSGYRVALPGAANRPARCNPVSAPRRCRNEWIVD